MSWTPSMASEFYQENKVLVFSKTKKRKFYVTPIQDNDDENIFDQIILGKGSKLIPGDIIILDKTDYVIMDGSPSFYAAHWTNPIFFISPVANIITVKKGKYKIKCMKKDEQRAIEKIDRFIANDEFQKDLRKWKLNNLELLKEYNQKYVMIDPLVGVLSSGETKDQCIAEYVEKFVKQNNPHERRELYFVNRKQLKKVNILFD